MSVLLNTYWNFMQSLNPIGRTNRPPANYEVYQNKYLSDAAVIATAANNRQAKILWAFTNLSGLFQGDITPQIRSDSSFSLPFTKWTIDPVKKINDLGKNLGLIAQGKKSQEAAFYWTLNLVSEHVIGLCYEDKAIFALVQKAFIYQSQTFKRRLPFNPSQDEINAIVSTIKESLPDIEKELSKRVKTNNPKYTYFDFSKETDHNLKDPYIRSAALIQRFLSSRDIFNAIKDILQNEKSYVDPVKEIKDIIDFFTKKKLLSFIQHPFSYNELRLHKLFKKYRAI